MDPQNNIHLAGVADPVSAGTHLLGFLAALGGMGALLRRTATRGYERTLVVVYSLATAAQFLASVAYHTSEHDPVLRRIDHATIYVLIAGTYTPLTGAGLPPHLRAVVLSLIWAFGISGIVLKLFFFGITSEAVDTAFYLVAGWLGSIPTFLIWRRGDRVTTAWIMAGAILYTVGALCELFGWPKIVPRVFNFHEVFHLCVMAASAAFYVAVYRAIEPSPLSVRRT